MKKQGHRLMEMDFDIPGELLDSLRDKFSITTAEELVSSVARSGEELRQSLKANRTVWSNLIQSSRGLFTDDELRILETPVKSKFAKGAKLGKSTNKDLEKFLTRE